MAGLLAALLVAAAAADPVDLRINYLATPLGVDDPIAIFTWRLPQDRAAPSPQQLAARVVVVSASNGAVAFDSGVVATDQPLLVNSPPLPPMNLLSDAVYTWWVEVSPGGRSANATFTTGVLTQREWAAAGAQWIRGGDGCTQMRKEFVVPAGAALSRATLFVAACQYYTLYLDGAAVSDQRLDSPWTEFYTNRSYTTIDIDPSLLAPGPHALGLRVGQGFCAETAHDEFQPNAERSAIVLLQLHGAAGVAMRVATDGSWASSSGPIQYDSTYYGEFYDAREEQPGWASPNFVPPAGKTWGPVDTNFTVVAQLSAQMMPPIKVVREIPAATMTRVPVAFAPAACAADAPEGQPASVACPNTAISAVTFVSFGLPTGSCSGGLANGTCGTAANLTAAVEAVCVGQQSCSVACVGRVPPPYPNGQCTLENGSGASVKFVEGEPCGPVVKRTSLAVACAPPAPTQPRFKYVYDFGQEFAGVVRLTLPPGTPAGTRATIKHAEVLAHEPLAPADGSVYMGNLFWASPIDVYIASGAKSGEVYEPSFTYHGFRYVELTLDSPPPQGAAAAGDPPEPNLSSVMGLNLRSSVDEAGALTLGGDRHAAGNLLQRLSNNSWWTESAALMSIPAGAAARGERNGWTGDAAFASESECFDFDTGAFFKHYLAMVVDAQAPNGEIGGGVPDQGTAPTTTHHYQETPMDPSWSAVFPVVAYNTWKYYNCSVCIDRAWQGLALYFDMLYKNYSVSPTTYARWGDWNPASPTPRAPDGSGPPFVRTVSAITAAAMVVQNFDEAAELALATGRAAEAAQYAAWLSTSRVAYHASFFDPAGGVYGDATPTAFAAALWVGAVPSDLLPAVVERFVWQLSSTGYSLSTMGFIGVRYVFEALARANRTDVALRMLNRTAYPSFGYQITNDLEPATSLWECQDAPTMHQWVDESSRSHHYSASINTFLRKFLAGLDQVRGGAAWAVVKCRPEAALLPTLLPAASATVRSARGLVGCSWSATPLAGGLLPPPPPPPPPTAPPVFCAITPMFTGAVGGPSPMTLLCPAGAVVADVTYARWGVSAPGVPWFCWGPQPPPPGRCETDVRAKIAPLCVGRGGCNLSAVANQATLGGPCSGNQQLIVRVSCTAASAVGADSGEGAAGATPLVVPVGTVWAVVNATVPGGSTGEVHVPLLSAINGTITESGAVVWKAGKFIPGAAAGVRGGSSDGRFAWFFTQSGNYSFAAAV